MYTMTTDSRWNHHVYVHWLHLWNQVKWKPNTLRVKIWIHLIWEESSVSVTVWNSRNVFIPLIWRRRNFILLMALSCFHGLIKDYILPHRSSGPGSGSDAARPPWNQTEGQNSSLHTRRFVQWIRQFVCESHDHILPGADAAGIPDNTFGTADRHCDIISQKLCGKRHLKFEW